MRAERNREGSSGLRMVNAFVRMDEADDSCGDSGGW